jgi:acetyl esterase/lipase
VSNHHRPAWSGFEDRSGRRLAVGLAALVLGLLAGGAARADGEKAGSEAAPALYEVQIKENIPYYDGPDADPVRHKLDVYVPNGRKDFPVLFFVHGGGWVHGDKLFYGAYKILGTFFARRGIGAVIPNYRLSPSVRHPEHIKDVARAFAWAHKHVADFGSRSDQIFACGHSAGGHLVALLAADPHYLKAEGLSPRDIRGVIPISGVYQLSTSVGAFDRAFGSEPRVRLSASPTWQVEHWQAATKDEPPFLIIYGDQDFPLCGKGPSEEFCKALKDHQVEARTLEARGRNHMTVLLAVTLKGDLVSTAVLDFISTHTKK